MSVVLRCPDCGTTQGHVGECETCSEGPVRYFCTNHEEGSWLEGPVCTRCGATFGEPSRRPARVPSPATVPRHPAGTPDLRPDRSLRKPKRSHDRVPPARPPLRPEAHSEADAEVRHDRPTLGELLDGITDTRTRRPEPSWVDEKIGAGSPGPSIGSTLGGCVLRLLGLGLLALIAVVIFLYLLFGGFISG